MAEAVGVETASKLQTKDLTEHGQHLSPPKYLKKRELILSDLRIPKLTA
jgi:hypothetical protein